MTTRTDQRLQTHVSIDSADLARSVTFYRALFGREPVLERHDYARFWPADLGFVLGLNAVRATAPRPGTGALQHLGILFPGPAALGAARERLERAGFPSPGEADTVCCYARPDQFLVTDPDGVRRELFLAHEETVQAASRSASSGACCAPSCCD